VKNWQSYGHEDCLPCAPDVGLCAIVYKDEVALQNGTHGGQQLAHR